MYSKFSNIIEEILQLSKIVNTQLIKVKSHDKKGLAWEISESTPAIALPLITEQQFFNSGDQLVLLE
jgi:hypothetical protein